MSKSLCISLALALAAVSSTAAMASNTLVMAGTLTPSVSPVAPTCKSALTSPIARRATMKHARAYVSRAAICTEDLAHIKFQEYYVDWSSWMNSVADRWSTVFNKEFKQGNFQTEGSAYIQFTCDRTGKVLDVAVAKTSGDLLCDRSHIEALKDCVPLPQFPVGSRKHDVTLMYVWEYGSKWRAAKPKAKPLARTLDMERVSITGAAM